MKRLSFILSVILSGLLLGTCFADAPGKSKKGFFFIQMADTQFGMWSGNKDTVKEEETFQKAVDHINRLKPAFVLISGDLVNAPHNIKQTRAFWRIAHQIRPDIPLYLVAGNHDVGGGRLDDSIRSYEKLFGKDHYTFSHGDSRFIVLNTNLITNSSANVELDEAQRKWFQAQLEEARSSGARHIFVCSHHPWFLKTPDEKNQYFNIPLEKRSYYLDLMKEYKVEMALAGHLHQNSIGSDGTLQMITNAPVGKPLGKDPSGLRIIWVYKDRVESQYYGLEEVPGEVKM